jgi:hypothetical protein
VLTVPVLDTDIERVPVTEIVDVRDEVVVLETVGELVVDPVKLAETEDDTLELPERDSVLLTEGVIVGAMVRVKEGWAEPETLTEADELRVTPVALGLTVPEILTVRDTVTVSVCVHVKTRVAVEVAVFAVDPDAVLLFVRVVIPVEDTVTDADAVLVALGLADSVDVIAPL